MARKPAGRRRGPPPVPPAPQFPKQIIDEPDPEWRQWFREIEQRRRDRVARQRAAWVYSRVEKADGSREFFRKKSAPTLIKQCLQVDEKKAGRKIGPDLGTLRALWEKTVGAEIAGESAVYSFKNGVLTITIFNSALLQEIRQFHQAPLEADLRDAWTLAVPLTRVVYRLGKRA